MVILNDWFMLLFFCVVFHFFQILCGAGTSGTHVLPTKWSWQSTDAAVLGRLAQPTCKRSHHHRNKWRLSDAILMQQRSATRERTSRIRCKTTANNSTTLHSVDNECICNDQIYAKLRKCKRKPCEDSKACSSLGTLNTFQQLHDTTCVRFSKRFISFAQLTENEFMLLTNPYWQWAWWWPFWHQQAIQTDCRPFLVEDSSEKRKHS